MQLTIIIIQCYITNSNRITPLSKRLERLMAELRPGSRPENKTNRNPFYMENDDANNDFLSFQ